MKQALNIFVRGTLWKRGFRFYSMQKAVELGIAGTVQYGDNKNEIIIHAEGVASQLEVFLNWCNLGSPSYKITNVENITVELKYYNSFNIIEKE
ncbi:MAG: hypothetical protein CVU14_02165 [Bacteroidetes bacterium HGW-Bacteroidetes-9]|jgi:acylphosphatase|nr:MAG: hypothetical protein CVU14_02165 [Bacteroidetes bacterium HGW-Bacteroidetes-9]